MAPIPFRDPATWRWTVWIVIGAASSLVWTVMDTHPGDWLAHARLWGVFVAGSVIGFTIKRGSHGGQFKSRVVDPTTNEDLFFDALNRELCRARRDAGSFAVLSVDRGAGHSETSLQSVCDLLDTELRAYADIVQIGKRVLALVPDVTDSQYAPLVERLTARSIATGLGEMRIGLARFPQEAVCAQDLIEMADLKRLSGAISQSPGENRTTAHGEQILS